jgi:hypothetical protein
MVQTRNQWREWAGRGFHNTQSSQGSNNSQQSYQDHINMEMENHDRNMYGPNDHCKRHRKEDGAPKTIAVTTYRRRVANR